MTKRTLNITLKCLGYDIKKFEFSVARFSAFWQYLTGIFYNFDRLALQLYNVSSWLQNFNSLAAVVLLFIKLSDVTNMDNVVFRPIASRGHVVLTINGIVGRKRMCSTPLGSLNKTKITLFLLIVFCLGV